MNVVHQKERKRFLVRQGGHEAFSGYIPLPDRIIFTHTEVPRLLEGMGIGGQLAEAGLQWTRSEGKKVVPLRPFVAGYMARHPEWKDMLMEGYSVG
jgi:hypothetical protein